MKFIVALALGAVTAGGVGFTLVSQQAPEDISPASSILEVYGTR